MKTIVAACVVVLGLTSCTAMQRDEAKACADALYTAQVRTLSDLMRVAQLTPPCMLLASDLWQRTVNEVAAARGMR